MADELEEPVTDDDLYEECEPGVGPEPAGKNADAAEAPFDPEAFTNGLVTLWRNFESVAPMDQEAKFAAWEAVVKWVYLALERHGNEDTLNMTPPKASPRSFSPVDAAISTAITNMTANIADIDGSSADYAYKLLALYRSVAHMAILNKLEADENYDSALLAMGDWIEETGVIAQKASAKVSRVQGLLGTLEQELLRAGQAASDLQKPIDAE